jgi:hypothetical protein
MAGPRGGWAINRALSQIGLFEAKSKNQTLEIKDVCAFTFLFAVMCARAAAAC